VGDVWAIWFVCAAILGWLLVRVLRRVSVASLRFAAADERGATYMLPYVMTFPIYMLVMCLMIQTTMILNVKLFSMHAVSAAIRSAVVWRSAHPYSTDLGGHLAVEHAHHAAAVAMVPIASSQTQHLANPLLESSIYHRGTGLNWYILRELVYANTSDAYLATYRQIAEDNVRLDRVKTNNFVRYPDQIAPLDYLDRKVKYAAWATRVEVDSNDELNEWNHDFKVELDYIMPMNLPGAGRILGQFHGRGEFHSRLIHTEAYMPMETPKTRNRLIGIGYDSTMLR
jgi:hypothetical protein